MKSTEEVLSDHMAAGRRIVIWSIGPKQVGEILRGAHVIPRGETFWHPFVVVSETTYADFAASYPEGFGRVPATELELGPDARFYEVTTD
jgi:hypothetical protein